MAVGLVALALVLFGYAGIWFYRSQAHEVQSAAEGGPTVPRAPSVDCLVCQGEGYDLGRGCRGTDMALYSDSCPRCGLPGRGPACETCEGRSVLTWEEFMVWVERQGRLDHDIVSLLVDEILALEKEARP